MGSNVRRVIGAVLIIAGTIVTGGAGLALVVAGTAWSISGQRLAVKDQRRKALREANRAGQQAVTVVGGVQSAVTGYGETIVGAVQVDYRTINDEPNEVYDGYQLLAHCHRKGGIEGITGYYFDDSYLAYPGDFEGGSSSTARGHGHGGVPQGTWGPRNWGFRFSNRPGDGAIAIRWRDGAQSTGIPEFQSKFDDYTANDVGNDVCYTVVVVKLRGGEEATNTKAIVGGGTIRVRSIIKLNRVYDPRKDSTRTLAKDGFVGNGTHRLTDESTWEWTDNPCLAFVDYMYSYSHLKVRTNPEIESYSTRIDDRLFWQLVQQTADYCDGGVDIPGGKNEKRYRCDVLLDIGFSDNHATNMRKILSSFGGKLVRIGDKFHIYPIRAIAAPGSLAYGPSDIAGNYQLTSNQRIDERYNSVGGAYYDRDRDWTLVDAPVRQDAQAIARDGVIELDLDGSAITRGTQMQRLAHLTVKQLALQEIVNGLFNWKGLRLQPETTFTLDLPEFGAPKKFRVISTTIIHNDAPMGVTAIEDDDSVYVDLPASDYHVVSPDGDVAIAEARPFAPTAFNATGVRGGIVWKWKNPTLFDETILFTSATANWSDRVETWRGKADEYLSLIHI